MYGDGRILREEYLNRTEVNEREIAHWQSRTSDTQKAGMELAMCLNAVDRIARIWETGSAQDKQSLIQGLFTAVYYDLDTRRITDFKLKPWADRYLVVRTNLYEAEKAAVSQENKTAPAFKGLVQDVPPRREKTNHLFPRLVRFLRVV